MSYLLDTCTISELIKPRPEPAVVDWIRNQAEDRLNLSVVTLGEIEKGIVKLRDEARQQKLRSWVEKDLQRRFEGRLLAITPEIAQLWGRVQGEAERRGRKMPVLDGLIAATALHFDFAVVTRNTDDLEPSGVEVVNPWP